jgi:hypothetical protein
MAVTTPWQKMLGMPVNHLCLRLESALMKHEESSDQDLMDLMMTGPPTGRVE